MIELPRLVLNYYWILAWIVALAALLLTTLSREDSFLRQLGRTVFCLAIAWIPATMIGTGKLIGFASHDLMSDLLRILLAFAILYPLVQTAANHWMFAKKEAK